MIYLLLFSSFFKIGLFSFGGGYAMIPLMQAEVETYGWISVREFADIVAISQITPGPVAVNAATYIGYRTAGIVGSLAATTGVSLPSFIIILFIAHFLVKFKESGAVRSIFTAIRPVTVGLIGAAVFFFAELSILREPIGLNTIPQTLFAEADLNLHGVDIHPGGLLIAAIVFIGMIKFRLHPIPALFFAMVLGIFVM